MLLSPLCCFSIQSYLLLFSPTFCDCCRLVGQGGGRGREGQDGPVREFLSTRTAHTGTHPQVDRQSCHVKVVLLTSLGGQFLERIFDHLKVKLSIFNNLPNKCSIPQISKGHYLSLSIHSYIQKNRKHHLRSVPTQFFLFEADILNHFKDIFS